MKLENLQAAAIYGLLPILPGYRIDNNQLEYVKGCLLYGIDTVHNNQLEHGMECG